MIIRLHVILVSHIASRRLIELDVRLAAGGRAARTREPWYEPRGDSVQIEFGPVTRERFKEPVVSGATCRRCGRPRGANSEPFKRTAVSGSFVAEGRTSLDPEQTVALERAVVRGRRCVVKIVHPFPPRR